MFAKTIGRRVKKVLAQRLKEAEKEYKECETFNDAECRAKLQEAQAEKSHKNMEAADNIVKKVLGS